MNNKYVIQMLLIAVFVALCASFVAAGPLIPRVTLNFPSDGANLTATNGTTDSVSGRVSVTTNTTTNITNVTVYLLTSGNASLAVLYTNTTTDQQNVSFNFSFAVAAYSNSVRNLTLYAEVKAADAGGAGTNLTGVDTNVNLTIINTVTVAIVSPSNSTNQTAGSLTMNMSHTTTIDALEVISYPLTCTFLSSGANASITNTSRISGNHTLFINASMTERLHKLRGTCVDATTGAVGNSPLIDFTRDATAPFNANATASSSSVAYGSSVDLACVSADSISNLSNASLYVQPAGLSGFRVVAFNFTTNNASFSFTETRELGEYLVNCTVTDYTGNQNSSTISFEVVRIVSDQKTPLSVIKKANEEKSSSALVVARGGSTNLGTLGAAESIAAGADASLKFSVVGEEHTLTINEITADALTVTIESTPQEVTINKGASEDVDVNGDGVNDVRVTYNGMDSKKRADLTVEALEQPADGAAPSTPEPTPTPAVETSGSSTMWIVIIAIIVVVIIGYFVMRRKQ
ncbi:MAG: hypothetical protein Q7R96_03980 [Nanoarchaeota archaeon]|nr:hypothetical protein [Nanoarchaeota archaeon]